MLVLLLQASVDLFRPIAEAIDPAATGLNQCTLALQSRRLSIETRGDQFAETMDIPLQALLHVNQQALDVMRFIRHDLSLA